MIRLADNLKFLRERKGRAQSDVAAMVDVKRSTYSGWENDLSEPPLERLVQLSEYHQVPVDLLLSAGLRFLPERELGIIQRSYKPA